MSEQQRRFRDIPVDRSEGFGDRLLGVLLDRAHEVPPQLVAPLIAEEVAKVGGRDLSVLLQTTTSSWCSCRCVAGASWQKRRIRSAIPLPAPAYWWA